jgi:ATP-dependent helicase HrpB
MAALCEGMTSLAEVRSAHLGQLVAAQMSREQRRALDRKAPDQVRLAGGGEQEVHYPADAPPWIETYLQDFFGMPDGPRAGGEALVLHLWAPNGRAVQVTADLASFWRKHYPALRRQLSRRYPKHHWPDAPERARAVRLRRHVLD